KYSFVNEGREYIIRCFQPHRKDQAEIEYRYLCLFLEKGIKAPRPHSYSKYRDIPYIVYEKLEGEPLADCYDSLQQPKQESLCREIAENYRTLSEIQNKGDGRIQDFEEFSDPSWRTFLIGVIEKAKAISKDQHDEAFIACCRRMKEFALGIPEPNPDLIWSDFSSDNIIVDIEGRLSGFIAFEGLLSGDPLLGLGYLSAHEKNRTLVCRLIEAFHASSDSDLINFYSLIRWCRLLPYQHLPLLNGTEREPLRNFLFPAYRFISSFNK
ncbi:MAG: phosphotransferase, partial [Allobaculum sp.]|nr:phosphotransferase [Allobaculum sp.]